MNKQQGLYARSLLLVTVLVVLVVLAMPMASLGLDIGRRGLGDASVVPGGGIVGCATIPCPPPPAPVSP